MPGRIRISLSPAYAYAYLETTRERLRGVPCRGCGLSGARIASHDAVSGARGFLETARFSGREVNFFGVGVPPPPRVLKFSLRYLRNMARFGSSAAAMRRSRRPASIWPCLMRHKPWPNHPSPKAESRAIAVSKASLASLRLFSALKRKPRNA